MKLYNPTKASLNLTLPSFKSLIVDPNSISDSFVCTSDFLQSMVSSFSEGEIVIILESGLEGDLIKMSATAEDYVLAVGIQTTPASIQEWFEGERSEAKLLLNSGQVKQLVPQAGQEAVDTGKVPPLSSLSTPGPEADMTEIGSELDVQVLTPEEVEEARHAAPTEEETAHDLALMAGEGQITQNPPLMTNEGVSELSTSTNEGTVAFSADTTLPDKEVLPPPADVVTGTETVSETVVQVEVSTRRYNKIKDALMNIIGGSNDFTTEQFDTALANTGTGSEFRDSVIARLDSDNLKSK